MSFLHFSWFDPERLRLLLQAQGVWAPFLFIFLQAAQVVLAPIPGEVTGFLAGYLFGPWWGLFYAMLGLVLGSSLAFALARMFRHKFEHRFVSSPHFQRLSRFMANRGIWAAFLCFLIPGFPKDYLSYFLGLFPIPWPVFLFIMTLGRLPGTLALTLQGAALYQRDWQLLALVAGISILSFLCFYLFRDKVYAYLGGENAGGVS